MLLTQFRKVQEIDARIDDIQRELLKLYGMRSELFGAPGAAKTIVSATPEDTTPTVNLEENWKLQKYDELAGKWKHYDVTVPSFKKLSVKLSRAYKIINQLSSLRPELSNKMVLVLVPPTKDIHYSQSSVSKSNQPNLLLLSADYLEAKFTKAKADKNWRVLVVFAEPEGLYLGTPHQVLSEKRYAVADYDTHALGITEYSAMVMQERTTKFDESTWTILLKGCAPDAAVIPCVKFDGARFTFSAETTDSVFGDIKFRPAIEVA